MSEDRQQEWEWRVDDLGPFARLEELEALLAVAPNDQDPMVQWLQGFVAARRVYENQNLNTSHQR